MKIDFDKRLELIYGLLYCVDKDLNHNLHPGLFEEELPTYCSEFYELYKNNVSEELLEYIKNYSINGNWNQPAIIALSLDNYNIIDSKCLDTNVIEKNNNFSKEKAGRLLKEFAIKSNYDEFYEKHRPLYDNIINNFKKSMSKYNAFDDNFILDFYGYKIGNMSIKLYNFTSGSMGLLIGDNQYYIQRVSNIGVNEEQFQFKPKLFTMIHEFSHPYINPLVDKYLSNYDFSDMYEELKRNGLPKAYISLKNEEAYHILKEYIVRAVSIYLASKYECEENIEKEIKKQIDNGFIYIGKFAKLFDKKDNYDSFEEFFKKEIVDYCLTLSNHNKSVESQITI